MHNKDKLHKKYLIQKRFLINKVLHEIFKRDRNINKKTATGTKIDYFGHYFIQGPKLYEKNMGKNMQITNVNKRFTAFPRTIKHENHVIINGAMIPENSNDFVHFLLKS